MTKRKMSDIVTIINVLNIKFCIVLPDTDTFWFLSFEKVADERKSIISVVFS